MDFDLNLVRPAEKAYLIDYLIRFSACELKF